MGAGKQINPSDTKDASNLSLNVGNHPSSNIVYLIDLGFAKRFIDKSGKHLLYKENKRLTGTPRYASVNAHLGIE